MEYRKKIIGILKIIIIAVFLLFLFIQGIITVNFKSDINIENEEKLDYIIILGAKVVRETPSKVLMERIREAVKYLEKNLEIKVITTGGKGDSAVITEAEAIKRILVLNGIKEDRIFLESNSKNTVENLKFSMNIIKFNENTSDISNIKIGIVTNNFHLFRSKSIAKDLGIKNIYGISAKTPLISMPKAHIREFFSVIKYFFEKINK